MIRINSLQDAKSVAETYWNNQVLQWKGGNEEANALASIIYNKLIFLGVPRNDLSNYTELLDIFMNWLIGNYVQVSNSERIQHGGIDPSKGFYLVGEPGTGKTTFMDAVSLALIEYSETAYGNNICFFSHYKKNNKIQQSVKFRPLKVRANSITRAFRIGGDIGKIVDNKPIGGTDRYSVIGKNEDDTPHINFDGDLERPEEKRYPILYVDDFRWGSTNNNTSSFGNSVDILTEVIKNRYDKNLLTFITSNTTQSDIDSATKDRMKSMFNVIVLKGNSFRK